MNLPTLLSLARCFLGLFFLSDSLLLRTVAIVLAALSDFFDGYLARRLNQITRLGTFLDPLADKLFVGLTLFILWNEGAILLWQIGLFLLRDLSLLAFSFYLWYTERLGTWQVRSFFSGKVMTTLQFIALLFLAQNYSPPAVMWPLFALFGTLSFFDLKRLA